MHHEWYDRLREQYRPRTIRVLLIAESPPHPHHHDRRFFYAPTLTRHDNLYRGVAEAVYGVAAVRDKLATLERLQRDGFWLIDATAEPINQLPAAARRRALRSAVPQLVRRCVDLRPSRGVIICHTRVYDLAAPSLRRAGVPVLHDRPLPFPLGNWRAAFVRGVRDALDDPSA